MSIKYFILDSVEQADQLSRLMWKLCYPDGAQVETTHLFDWVVDGGVVKIRIPENYTIPVYMKSDFEQILNDMATVLNGYLTEAEGQRIAALLRTGQANILDLVPAGLQEQ